MIMTEKNQEEVEVDLDLPETKEGEEDTTDWKAEATKLREKAIAQRERTKSLKEQLKTITAEKEKKVEITPVKPTGELDDTQLDYLDLKGYTEDEDIAVIKSIMQKTGQTVRQALKDDYVIAKLKDLKVARDVKNATPTATKRSGQQASDNEDYWFQKYEVGGELPKGMPQGMAQKLVRRKAAQDDTRRNPYE